MYGSCGECGQANCQCGYTKSRSWLKWLLLALVCCLLIAAILGIVLGLIPVYIKGKLSIFLLKFLFIYSQVIVFRFVFQTNTIEHTLVTFLLLHWQFQIMVLITQKMQLMSTWTKLSKVVLELLLPLIFSMPVLLNCSFH